ncbi:MAG: hypothetical protein ABEJ28_11590 [Salinigranum sp.]
MFDDRQPAPSAPPVDAREVVTPVPSLDRVYSVLARPGCRRVVAALRDRHVVSEAALATLVAALERGTPPTEVTPDERRRAFVSLRHSHLPRLADANLVARDRREGSVALVNRSLLEASGAFEWVAPGAVDEATCDAVFAVLSDPRRRTVVAVLDEVGRPIALDALAAAVAAREGGVPSAAPPPSRDVADRDATGDGDLDAVLATLHHVHLPKLVDLGAVDYDPTDRRITYLGAPWRSAGRDPGRVTTDRPPARRE